MKRLFLSLVAAGLLFPVASALADSSIKNVTGDYEFVEITCPSGGYTKQVNPGRRIVVPSSEFGGGTCTLQVEGQSAKYVIRDHNNYQIQANGTVTKTSG